MIVHVVYAIQFKVQFLFLSRKLLTTHFSEGQRLPPRALGDSCLWEAVLNLASVILKKRKDRKCGITSKKWRQVPGHSPNKAFRQIYGAFVTSGVC